jgi:hypothetical protein
MLKEYILRTDYAFWEKRGRKILYSAGSKLLVEEEVLSTNSGQESRYYYCYSKPNVLLGYYEKEEFFEIFMTLEESRDKKISDII